MLPTNDAVENAAGEVNLRPSSHQTFPNPCGANLAVAAGDTLRARSHRAMGTEFVVYLDAEDGVQARACFDAVFDEIDRLEITFSRFQRSSELSRLNRHAGEGPVVTDPEVFELVATALDLSEKTGGAFDLTVGRLTRAWGFAGGQPRIPEQSELAAAKELVGWGNVILDAEWRTVQFARPGVELDLGAIAKGYAVDRAIDMLRSLGVSALIDAGSSSVAAVGEAFSRGWKVGIANPLDRGLTICEVELGQRALSTSGVREKSFVHDGRVYSHLLDPRTSDAGEAMPGTGAGQVLQVTVLAPSSMLADALSTAMFVLGHEHGSAALAQFADCSALWIHSEADGIRCFGHGWPGDDFLS
jgi:thiamine biosynthesis lipoprotein